METSVRLIYKLLSGLLLILYWHYDFLVEMHQMRIPLFFGFNSKILSLIGSCWSTRV